VRVFAELDSVFYLNAVGKDGITVVSRTVLHSNNSSAMDGKIDMNLEKQTESKVETQCQPERKIKIGSKRVSWFKILTIITAIAFALFLARITRFT